MLHWKLACDSAIIRNSKFSRSLPKLAPSICLIVSLRVVHRLLLEVQTSTVALDSRSADIRVFVRAHSWIIRVHRVWKNVNSQRIATHLKYTTVRWAESAHIYLLTPKVILTFLTEVLRPSCTRLKSEHTRFINVLI